MSWNFRVLAFEYTSPFGTKEVQLKICEVYLNKKFLPRAYAEGSDHMNGDSKRWLKLRLDKPRGF